MNSAVSVIFFDRDGTINNKMKDGEYVTCWDEFKFLEDVFFVLRTIKQRGYIIILVTNQRCIAKKIISINTLNQIHKKMQLELDKHNCSFDKIFYCPHEICENCNCRKPNSGMLSNTEKYYNIDRSSSYIVGDTKNDILAGLNYGITTIKIGDTCSLAHYNVQKLRDILKIIK